MTWRGKSVLAVVPARGGSKGIVRKNLQRVGGLTLVERAARMAGALDWLDRAVLSTEDPEIAEIGRRAGLDVPFVRPAVHAADDAGSVGMWRHAWLASESHFSLRFDCSVLLEPTSPLRRPADIEKTLDVLLAGKQTAAATVSPTPAHFSPERCLILEASNTLRGYVANALIGRPRQSLPAYYFRNGICYAAVREGLLGGRDVLAEDCAAVVIERPVVNIDEPLDLELAEFFLKRELNA